MLPFEEKIDRLLSMPPYGLPPEERQSGLLDLLKDELDYASGRHAGYKNFIQHWPTDFRAATRVADLPFLPVGVLKANPPLCFVNSEEIKRTLTSSSTTSQVPSRLILDSRTARRMPNATLSISLDRMAPD